MNYSNLKDDESTDAPVRTRAQQQAKEEEEAVQKPVNLPPTCLQPVVEIEVWQPKDKQRKDTPAS